jgi:hypothetical protein
VRPAGRGAGAGDRVLDDLVDRQAVVLQAIDEGAVGPVLEQAADEIGQEVLVLADGRIDAAADAEAVALHDLLVEGLAHAVQALELEGAGVAGELEHGGDGVGVVGGELGIEELLLAQQLSGAGEVGDVGEGFLVKTG